ncbi:hypothetical protein NUW54_g4298 [Trametes sanguinea]|uniref:Uncharacterized protein n=1 Tax=Trametes sanguinea TaxID=158606 RepID=A0ACC1PZL1_9APHY|nr:hypothetical protein NUW54_g4298 [Trametes sanguinea]
MVRLCPSSPVSPSLLPLMGSLSARPDITHACTFAHHMQPHLVPRPFRLRRRATHALTHPAHTTTHRDRPASLRRRPRSGRRPTSPHRAQDHARPQRHARPRRPPALVLASAPGPAPAAAAVPTAGS